MKEFIETHKRLNLLDLSGKIEFAEGYDYKALREGNTQGDHGAGSGADMQKGLFERITVDPEVMVGKPTIRGMRITVEQILKSLAGGLSIKELLEDYPELEEEDVRVALLYASGLVESPR